MHRFNLHWFHYIWISTCQKPEKNVLYSSIAILHRIFFLAVLFIKQLSNIRGWYLINIRKSLSYSLPLHGHCALHDAVASFLTFQQHPHYTHVVSELMHTLSPSLLQPCVMVYARTCPVCWPLLCASVAAPQLSTNHKIQRRQK